MQKPDKTEKRFRLEKKQIKVYKKSKSLTEHYLITKKITTLY